MRKVRVFFLAVSIACLMLGCGQSTKVEDAPDSQTTEKVTESESEMYVETEVETETEVVVEPESESEPQPEPAPEPEITYTYENMEQMMYTTISLNVRKGPDKGFEKIGNLGAKDEVVVTGRCKETGWYRIAYNGAEAYVSNVYLTTEKPPAVTPRQYYDTGDAELNALCDEILDELVDSSMTERETAYKVYCWIEDKINYKGGTDMTDWVAVAKEVLVTRKGNCFAYYSVSRAMLTRLGYENVMATEYEFTHYWNMVKVDGCWWHWDTTNNWGTQRFLWTSEQLLAYKKYKSDGVSYIFYDWNPEGCPETP
mgnify:CR=1 FL=1